MPTFRLSGIRPISSAHRAAAVGLVTAALCAVGIPAVASPPGDTVPSLNHAGYGVTADAVHRVVAGWTQPKVTCGASTSYADFRISFAHGVHPVALGTAAECHHGVATYYAWESAGGRRQRLDEVVRAGDVMQASLMTTRSGISTSIDDQTQGWGEGSGSGGSGGPPQMTRATFGVFARSGSAGVLPLAHFAPAEFTKATVNKAPLAGPDARRFTMRDVAGGVKAVASQLGDGGSFDVTWRHQ